MGADKELETERRRLEHQHSDRKRTFGGCPHSIGRITKPLRGALWALAVVMAASCGKVDPQEELMAAQSSFAQGDYRTAAIRISNVLQANPENADARIVRGRLALVTGNPSEARDEFARALRMGAEPAAVALADADAALNLGAGEEALDVLERSLASFESDASYWTLRGYALSMIGRFDEAADAFSRSSELEPDSGVNLIGRAQLALRAEAHAEAEALLTEAVAVGARDPEVHRARGTFYLSIGRLEEATADLEIGARLYEETTVSSQETSVLATLVQVYLGLGNVDAAARAADRLGSRASNSPVASYAYGMVELARDRLNEAMTFAQRAVVAEPDNSRFLILLGTVQLRRGNLGQAEQHVLSALANASQDATANKLLAEIRIRQQRPQAALDSLQLFTPLDPDFQFELLTGLANFGSGNVAQAIAAFERALALDPDNQALKLELARAYFTAERDDDAARLLGDALGTEVGLAGLQQELTLLAADLRSHNAAGRLRAERIVEQFPDRAQALAAVAIYYQLADEGEAALRYAERAVAIDGESLPSRLLLARLYALGGLLDQAEPHARKALEIDGDSSSTLALLGQILAVRGSLEEAEAFLVRAAQTSGDEAIHLLLARVQIARQDGDGALRTLRAALTVAPFSMQLRMALGSVELRFGDLDAAAANAESLQADFSSRNVGYLLEGETHLARRLYDAADRSFDRAFELEPTWEVLTRRVTVLQLAGRYGEADRLIEEWLGNHPEHAEAHLFYASYLQASDRAEPALERFEYVLGLDPNNVVALNDAAWLRNELGAGGALELALQAHEFAPDNPAVLDTLGWILVEQKREQDGIGYLERAAELAPQALEIRYHLAEAQARLGRNGDARATLLDLLAEQISFGNRGAAQALLESL